MPLNHIRGRGGTRWHNLKSATEEKRCEYCFCVCPVMIRLKFCVIYQTCSLCTQLLLTFYDYTNFCQKCMSENWSWPTTPEGCQLFDKNYLQNKVLFKHVSFNLVCQILETATKEWNKGLVGSPRCWWMDDSGVPELKRSYEIWCKAVVMLLSREPKFL